ETTDESVTVAELSSFQLELIADTFRPNIGVFLNLTPDHLDRHASMDAYGAAKARLFKNQTEQDAAVLNADDTATAAYAPAGPQLFWFSRKQRVAQGAFMHGDEIIFRSAGQEEVVLHRADVPLLGEHNLENVLAAVVTARMAAVEATAIARGVQSFGGVEHRLEFVTKISGVSYYNDSKATNVDATIKALEAFPGRVLV